MCIRIPISTRIGFDTISLIFPVRYPGLGTWLRFCGINYTATDWLNGLRLTSLPLTGMFLRHEIDVTDYLKPGTNNRLVLLVEPPRPPGNPPTERRRNRPRSSLAWASSCQGEDRPYRTKRDCTIFRGMGLCPAPTRS